MIAIISIFSIKSCRDENEINGHEIYFIGKLYHSDDGGSESGWVYKVKYFFKGSEYYRGFTGPVPEKFLKDSLVVLRVSAKNPHLSKHAFELTISDCLFRDNLLNRSWTAWPPDCP